VLFVPAREEEYIVAHTADQPTTRRDFLYIATAAFGAVGAAAAVWPLIDQMNPDKSVLALSSTEVNISAVQPGQQIVVKWRGKPVFILHRTPEQIATAEHADWKDLRDPEPDSARVQRPQWLVLIGICTHLGCETNRESDGTGWLCPCHGSVYDNSGRRTAGPAPLNMAVPPYKFESDTTVLIG
jgi:ubiquinol-cytochrome c reductase iron-sulfur subunit